MKVYGMPEEAKSFKWIITHEYKGKQWYVNAWQDKSAAVSHAVVGGYKVTPIEEVKAVK